MRLKPINSRPKLPVLRQVSRQKTITQTPLPKVEIKKERGGILTHTFSTKAQIKPKLSARMHQQQKQ